MFRFGIELHPGAIGQFDQLTIDSSTDKTFSRKAFYDVPEFSLLLANHWRQQHHSCAWRESQNFVNDIAGRLCDDGTTSFGTERFTHMRKKQAEVIVNLGGSRNNRAGVGA